MRKILTFLIMFSFIISFSCAARDTEKVYHPKEEILSNITNWCFHSPYCEMEIIGHTYMGKPIPLLKIGNPRGGSVMIDGSMHGSEDSGTEIIFKFTHWLLFSNDTRAQRILERNYALFIPIVNIDSTGRYNMRRENDDGTPVPFGVDLNRNFKTGWGESGSYDPLYDWPSAYLGSAPLSEPESQAVYNTLQKYLPQIYLNMHHGWDEWYSYAKLTETEEKVIHLYDVICDKEGITDRYTIRQGQIGGMAKADAEKFGSSAWICEVVHADDLSESYDDFINKYYPKNFPMFLAMFQAVELNQTTKMQNEAKPLRDTKISKTKPINPTHINAVSIIILIIVLAGGSAIGLQLVKR